MKGERQLRLLQKSLHTPKNPKSITPVKEMCPVLFILTMKNIGSSLVTLPSNVFSLTHFISMNSCGLLNRRPKSLDGLLTSTMEIRIPVELLPVVELKVSAWLCSHTECSLTKKEESPSQILFVLRQLTLLSIKQHSTSEWRSEKYQWEKTLSKPISKLSKDR